MSEVPPLSTFTGHLVLVGAGQMGGALLKGWLRLGLDPRRVTIFDPKPPASVMPLIEAGHIQLNPDNPPFADTLVLAIKPQMADEVMPKLTNLVSKTTLILSVMAGKTIHTIESALGEGTAVVRTIPNTPASVGRGITAAVPNKKATPAHIDTADLLLSAVGAVEWLTEESLIDAVTALSGSGPAYVFYLTEILARAGVEAGLDAGLSARLARATVEGAAELMHRSPDVPPETLRQNVTSPNGTTYAALQVMMGPTGIDPIIVAAIQAAAKRSRELAG